MDDFGPDEQRWLDVLRAADEPTPEDRARVRAAVIASVAGSGAAVSALGTGGAVAKSAGAASVFAGTWKIGLVVVSLAVLGAVAVVFVGRAPTAARAPVAVASSVAPVPEVAAVASVPVVPVVPVVPAPEATETAPAPATEGEGSRDEPKLAAPVLAKTTARAKETRPAPSQAQAKTDDVEAELALLTQAQRALERGDPNGALAALTRHGREHPQGALSVEREGLRAVASCDAKHGDGRVLAERFIAKNPSSPLVTRVRASCSSP